MEFKTTIFRGLIDIQLIVRDVKINLPSVETSDYTEFCTVMIRGLYNHLTFEELNSILRVLTNHELVRIED